MSTLKFKTALAGLLAVLVCMLGLSKLEFTNHLAEELDERLYRSWTAKAYDAALPHDMLETYQSLGVFLIDEESLEMLGLQWPLPRALYATIVDNLRQAGAKTIGLDTFFFEPSREPAHDQVLGTVLSHDDVIVAGQLRRQDDVLELRPPLGSLIEGWTDEDFRKRLGTVCGGPVTSVTNEQADAFGDMRYAALRIDHQPRDASGQPNASQQRYHAWDVLLLAHFLDKTPAQILASTRYFLAGTDFQELDCEFSLGRISYLPPGIDTRHRWADVPEGLGEGEIRWVDGTEAQETSADFLRVFTLKQLLVEPDTIKEAFGGNPFLALVGVAIDGVDVKDTPVGALSGVEIHANIVANLLNHRFLLPNPYGTLHVLAIILGCLTIGFFTARHHVGLSVAVFGILLSSHYLLARWLFAAQQTVLPLALPSVALLATFLVVLVLRARRASESVSAITELFQEVCPLHDLEKLEAQGGLPLGGEERVLTILFSDLRGYTSFAEKMDAVTVLDTLNVYFGCVGEVFQKHGGCVFDYQGDAQMVVFGLLPASEENHAASACKAGVEMILRLQEMQRQWAAEGRELPGTGVGICTGPVSFGVLGTKQHKQYVAIGDPTNTAARIQGQSDKLGCPVLITGSTYEMNAGIVPTKFLASVPLKGKSKDTEVYGLILGNEDEEIKGS